MTFSMLNTRSSVRLARSVLPFVLLMILLQPCRADSLLYMRIDRPVLDKRALAVPATPKDRLRVMRTEFRSAGCADHLQEQSVPGAELPNLICTLPGNDTGVIVIAASLDYKSHGDEERVQWATLELLPLLAESLNSSPHRETLVFAAFSGHEHGFAGSSHYVKNLSDTERQNLRGMIFLDHLGRVAPAYGYPEPDTSRVAMLKGRPLMKEVSPKSSVMTTNISSAARALNLAPVSEINDIAPTDTRLFAETGVLAINFHSPAYVKLPGIGGTETHLSRTELDPIIYADTYNLLCVYVLIVDKALGAEHANNSGR